MTSSNFPQSRFLSAEDGLFPQSLLWSSPVVSPEQWTTGVCVYGFCLWTASCSLAMGLLHVCFSCTQAIFPVLAAGQILTQITRHRLSTQACMCLHASADKDTPAHMCTYLAQDSRFTFVPSLLMVLNPPRSLLAPACTCPPCPNLSPAVVREHKRQRGEGNL